MIIRRLDVFFRTQLTTDQPAFFNSVTNYALAPLQYLVGKNQFQSLEGRITPVSPKLPPKPDAPLPYFGTLCKIVLYIGALVLSLFGTPIGTVTRCLSFYCDSFPISIAYSNAYLLQLKPHERTPEEMKSAFAFLQNLKPETCGIILRELPDDLTKEFLELISNLAPKTRGEVAKLLFGLPDDLKKKYWDQMLTLPKVCGKILCVLHDDLSKMYLDQISDDEYKKLMPHLSWKLIAHYKEKKKKEALDNYLSKANRSLATLEEKLKKKRRVDEFRNDPLYHFPLCLIGQIEKDPDIVKRADKNLWKRCESLRNSCLDLLSPDDDEEKMMKTTHTNAYNIVLSAFQSNTIFFSELNKKLESKMKTADIELWIEKVRGDSKYPYLYPFYTYRQVLNSIGQMATNLEERAKVNSLEATFSFCLEQLKQTDLKDEKPNSDHANVNALMDAMVRLDNINELKKLIETQKN
ncbi:MAG TPA: hypothetical protein VFU89_00110 [Rhabdochlamydiaceae bacterium]|nr:hypothetical protein [Rhabdochlamydiaceae bacterium]